MLLIGRHPTSHLPRIAKSAYRYRIESIMPSKCQWRHVYHILMPLESIVAWNPLVCVVVYIGSIFSLHTGISTTLMLLLLFLVNPKMHLYCRDRQSTHYGVNSQWVVNTPQEHNLWYSFFGTPSAALWQRQMCCLNRSWGGVECHGKIANTRSR